MDTFDSQMSPVYGQQIAALQKFGIDADGITKGYACQIMDRLVGRAKQGKATIKQVQLLKRFGYEPIEWSFEKAGAVITRLAKNNWRRA